VRECPSDCLLKLMDDVIHELKVRIPVIIAVSKQLATQKKRKKR